MESHVLMLKNSAADFVDSQISYFISPGINCGFPSPAVDFMEVRLSITDFFTSNPTSTFFGKAVGRSLEGIGIFDGDFLVIDRSLHPAENDIIILGYEGGFTAKKVRKTGNQVFLISENPAFPPMEVTDPDNLIVWGVVCKVIRETRHNVKYARIKKAV